MSFGPDISSSTSSRISKPASRKRRSGGADEVAAAGDALLEAVEAVLPAGDAGLGAQPVLEEVELAARAQDPAQLVQRGVDVGDGAEGERAECGVDRCVGQRDRLAVEPDELDLDRRRGDPVRSTRPADGRRLDREHPLDLRRIDGDVQPGAEADLDDGAAQAGRDLGAMAADLTVVERDIGQPRDDVIVPESHVSSTTGTLGGMGAPEGRTQD